jgi:hypothetical protein
MFTPLLRVVTIRQIGVCWVKLWLRAHFAMQTAAGSGLSAGQIQVEEVHAEK